MTINQAQPWYILLRDRLVTYFNESEIRSLCFELGIDYEQLAGDTKGEKAMELIQFTARRSQMVTLLEHCAAQRPNLEWESLKAGAREKPVFWETPKPVTPIQATAPAQARPSTRMATVPRIIAGCLFILFVLGLFGVVKVLQSLPKSKKAQTVLPTGTVKPISQPETPQTQPVAYAVTASLPGEIIRVGQQRYQILETTAEPETADHFLLKLHVRMFNDGQYPVVLWFNSFRVLEDGVPREPSPLNASGECNAAVGGQSASDACQLMFSLSTRASDLQLKITDDTGKAEMILPITFQVSAPGSVLPASASTSTAQTGPFTVSASISSEQVRFGEVRYQVLSLQAEPYSSDKVLLTLQVRGANDGTGSVVFWGGSFRILEDGVPRAPESGEAHTCNILLQGQSSSDACQFQFVVSAQAKEVKLRIFDNLGAESILPVTFEVKRP